MRRSDICYVHSPQSFSGLIYSVVLEVINDADYLRNRLEN